MSDRGFFLRIFLPDGTADGLRIIEKSNWIGSGVVCPRALLPTARTRPEFQRPGIYVLTGPSDQGDVPHVYIGESERVGVRLSQHFAGKDFWTTAVFFVSKDDHLHKAHVRYLESRLISLAKEANRCELENGTVPPLPSLSEMDIAGMEGFLDEMLLCFPVLGITVFEKPSAMVPDVRLFYLRGKGIQATGYDSAQGFVVIGGSQAARNEVDSLPTSVSEHRQGLLERGVLAPNGDDSFKFTQDYTFTSPSLAAAILLGRSANGRVEWRDASNTTLKEIQERESPVAESEAFPQ